MATLPDASTLGLPTPQASQGVSSYQPHTRMENEAGMFEERAGNDLQQTGDILKNYQDKQDGIVALDAINKLKQASLNLAQDPENGFQNVKGNAVVGQPFVKQYQDRFAQQQGSIAAGLANDNQRRMFAQHAEVVGLGYQSDLYRHQAKETQVFNSQTRNDTIDLSLKDIAAHPYDQQTYDKNVAIVGATVVAQGKDMGLSGVALADYTKSTLSSLKSKALTYRTESMLQDNPLAAQDFYKQHEQEFDPQARIQLGQHIKTAADAQETRSVGQSTVQSVVSSMAGKVAPTIETYEKAEGPIIENLKLQAEEKHPGDSVYSDKMVQEGLSYLKQQKQVLQQFNTAGITGINTDIDNGATSISGLSSESQKFYSQSSPAIQSSIRNAFKTKNSQELTPDGAARYYKLLGQRGNDPEGFADLNLMNDFGRIPNQLWLKLAGEQTSINKKEAKDYDRDMNFRKMKSDTSVMLKPYLDSLGKNKQLVDDTKSQFYGRLQESEQQFHDDPKNGRWPTTPERQKIAAGLLTQVTTPSGHWYSGDKTTPVFQTNDLNGVTVQISKSDKPILQKTFQDVNGRVPNDDELTKWHTQLQQEAFKSTGQYLPARDLANMYVQYAARKKMKQPQSQAGQIPR